MYVCVLFMASAIFIIHHLNILTEEQFQAELQRLTTIDRYDLRSFKSAIDVSATSSFERDTEIRWARGASCVISFVSSLIIHTQSAEKGSWFAWVNKMPGVRNMVSIEACSYISILALDR